MNDYQLNTKYKDRLFRLIFHDKKELLELYNAVNESHYTNPDALEITTIEDVVYMGMRNDLSFIIGDEMSLYEHQSTFSPNLPLRGLFYFSSVYRAYIEPVKKKLYLDTALFVPFPQYIVFYNGAEKQPERQELKLSSLFVGNGKGKTPSLECTALVLNVNYGHNKELMERCKTLKEYAQFVAIVRRNLAEGTDKREVVERAVDECIRNDILAKILRKNRGEVVDSILTEWDEDEFREFLKEESWKKGHEIGREDGIKIGEERGEERGKIMGAVRICKKLGFSEEKTIRNLKEEYSLEEEEAKQYIEKYWK